MGQKVHTTSWDKKNHAPCQDKKKSGKILGPKKVTPPLDKKNHATFRDKKITQPPGTKKITQHLGTTFFCYSQDKNNGTKKSCKWLQITPNGSYDL